MTEFTRPILLVEDNPMDVDLTRRAFLKAEHSQSDYCCKRW